jgi:hypothetical protein
MAIQWQRELDEQIIFIRVRRGQRVGDVRVHIERERDRSASIGDVIEQRTTPRRQATDERQFGELHSFVWGLGGYVGLSPYSPYGAIPLPPHHHSTTVQ